MAFGRKTGGRTKGVLNKRRDDMAEQLAAAGITPLEFMIQVMRDPTEKRAMRLLAAKDAAPYVHPKLAQVEMTHKGDPEKPVRIEATLTADQASRAYLDWIKGPE